MPRFDNLSAEELEQIKRFIEETDIDTIDDEMRALVETHWQQSRTYAFLSPWTEGPRGGPIGHVTIQRRFFLKPLLRRSLMRSEQRPGSFTLKKKPQRGASCTRRIGCAGPPLTSCARALAPGAAARAPIGMLAPIQPKKPRQRDRLFEEWKIALADCSGSVGLGFRLGCGPRQSYPRRENAHVEEGAFGLRRHRSAGWHGNSHSPKHGLRRS